MPPAASLFFDDGPQAPSFYLKATMVVALACLWICDVVFIRKNRA